MSYNSSKRASDPLDWIDRLSLDWIEQLGTRPLTGMGALELLEVA